MIRLPLLLLAAFTLSCATTPQPDPARQRLETTPRHHEWVQINRGGRVLHAYLAFSERSSLSPAVVLIHENRGLNDWARSVADRLAEHGYIVLAPDFLSGAAPNGGRTSDFASEDAAREAISNLSGEQVMGDLDAAAKYLKNLPSVSGSISVAGFCWGGARAFEFANVSTVPLSAVFVFYGTGPAYPAAVRGIDSPVFGFYGGNDMRVNATIPTTEQLMAGAGKRFEPVIYEGAGHGFLRAGELPDASAENAKAAAAAWQRWLSLLAGTSAVSR